MPPASDEIAALGDALSWRCHLPYASLPWGVVLMLMLMSSESSEESLKLDEKISLNFAFCFWISPSVIDQTRTPCPLACLKVVGYVWLKI